MGSRRASAALPQSCAAVSKPTTTGELTEAGFVLDLHDRTHTRVVTYKTDSTALRRHCILRQVRVCWRAFVTVWCAHFNLWLYLVGSGGGCPQETRVLVNVSSQSSHQKACMRQHPSIRCIAAPAGSLTLETLETMEISGWMALVVCTPEMCVHATRVGFRFRSLGGASGFPPPPGRVSNQPLLCQEGVDDSVVWSRQKKKPSSRDCSVPCRLLWKTPARAQGACRLAGWVVRPCNPAGGLCTDVKMDYCNFSCLPRLLLIKYLLVGCDIGQEDDRCEWSTVYQ